MRVPSVHLRFTGRILVTAILIAVTLSGTPHAQETKKRPGPRVVEVSIQGYKYNGGKPVVVEAGDSVVWVNKDKMPHTAALYDGTQPFNTGFIQPGKKSDPILFLGATGPDGLEYHCDVHEYTMQNGKVHVRLRTPPLPTPEPPSPKTVHPQPPAPVVKQMWPTEHSMVATGTSGSAIFMHHYSLFNNPDHEFHVTVEAQLDDRADPSARKAYEDYRKLFPQQADVQAMMDIREMSLLTQIQSGARKSFLSRFSHTNDKADFSPLRASCPKKEEKIETQWGVVIPCLNDVRLTITRIIQFRHYHPKAWYPSSLIYQLYGNENEVFLAHEVTAAPSFMHVVQLKDPLPSFLTPELIRNSPLVSIPAKQLRAGKPRPIRTAVLDNNSHFLLAPPTGSLNAEAPLKEDEVITVLIQGDRQLRQLTIGKLVFFDRRILNR